MQNIESVQSPDVGVLVQHHQIARTILRQKNRARRNVFALVGVKTMVVDSADWFATARPPTIAKAGTSVATDRILLMLFPPCARAGSTRQSLTIRLSVVNIATEKHAVIEFLQSLSGVIQAESR